MNIKILATLYIFLPSMIILGDIGFNIDSTNIAYAAQSEDKIRELIIRHYADDQIVPTKRMVDKYLIKYYQARIDEIYEESAGKILYDDLGSIAAPDFIDQIGFQLSLYIAELQVGFMGAISSNKAIAKRIFTQQKMLENISNDIQLQVLIVWQADAPLSSNNFWKYDIVKRSMANAFPTILFGFILFLIFQTVFDFVQNKKGLPVHENSNLQNS